MITTVTLNASIDKAYQMNGSICDGTVMRVAVCKNSAGGKGLNVARNVKLCGGDVLATGMVGGFNGAYLEALLDKDGIRHQFLHVAGETRSCINILDEAYGSTEYLEPGAPVTAAECAQFLTETFPETIADSAVVTISGSVPAGVSADVYEKMIALAKAQGRQVILDTSGELLRRGIQAQPTMIKPNAEELELLFGRRPDSLSEITPYAKQLHADGIAYVVISLGGDGALLVCAEGAFVARPPRLEAVNTVGCGDSMVGAFAVALEQRLAAAAALKYAVSVASANACVAETGRFLETDRKRIFEQITVQKLD